MAMSLMRLSSSMVVHGLIKNTLPRIGRKTGPSVLLFVLDSVQRLHQDGLIYLHFFSIHGQCQSGTKKMLMPTIITIRYASTNFFGGSTQTTFVLVSLFAKLMICFFPYPGGQIRITLFGRYRRCSKVTIFCPFQTHQPTSKMLWSEWKQNYIQAHNNNKWLYTDSLFNLSSLGSFVVIVFLDQPGHVPFCHYFVLSHVSIPN
jgi:hypothetical protein